MNRTMLCLTIFMIIVSFSIGQERRDIVYLKNGAPERPIDETECDVLEKIGFLVVQDVLLSEVAELADIVLPGATFAEKDGSFTNSKGWIQRIRKSISAPGQAQPEQSQPYVHSNAAQFIPNSSQAVSQHSDP